MQGNLNLYKLYESCPSNCSNVIYCDGVKRDVVSLEELHRNICLISSFLDTLHLSNSTICCLIRPSLALPAIILGILKISSAFAFLDVHNSAKCLQAFQKYLPIKSLLVEICYLKDLEPQLCCCWKKSDQFDLDSSFIILQSHGCENELCQNSKKFDAKEMQHAIAYAVQTSGTTGEPKVVQVPHECIASNIIDLKSRFNTSADDVILQSTRITFDPSIIEIFLALSSGATLVIIPDYIRSVPQKLIEVIANNNITILQATPSLISSFGEHFLKDILLHEDSVLRVLAFGGEICPSLNKLQRWKAAGNKAEIYNLYGLTEVSCWASCFKIDFQTRNALSSVPLGEPLLNTKLQVLNDTGDVVEKGELYVGGFKRYCIIDDEKWPENSDLFMRATGDLVHKSSDGFIYFEGRNDGIIKYKGHKISMNLVNDIIETFPEMDNHFLHFDSSSERLYLFAVWKSNSSNSISKRECTLLKEVRRVISNLPVVSFVSVPFIPLTKHGKGDWVKLMNLANQYRKIPIENVSDESCVDYITSLWKDYTSQVTVKEIDNFVLKGGNSICAVQFAADIEWKFQLSLPLLIEKILNETFKDITCFVKSHLKDTSQHISLENYAKSYDSFNQPLKKKKYDNLHCFKVSCKQGHYENCLYINELNCCLMGKSSDYSYSIGLKISLFYKYDLKKCIDATPCILYLPESDQLMVLIGSHFGLFSCIDINKKLEMWHVLVPDRIESSACISACGNYVLFGCYDHHLYCLNAASGNIHWKLKTNAEVKSSPSVSCNNTAFVGSHDKYIYSVDIERGHLLWKKQIACGSIFSSPAVIEKLQAICVASLDGVLALLKMDSGDVLWKYHSEKPLFSSPLFAFDSLYIGSTDNSLLHLDLDGKMIFKYSTEGPVFSSASFHKDLDEKIIFGCHDCYVYCITSDGNLVWKTICDSAVYATPFIFKRNCFYVCTASSKGTLYILQESDGKIVASWSCPGEVFSSPIVLNDILAVGCRDNNVYCLNLTNII